MKKLNSSDACRQFRSSLSEVAGQEATEEQVAQVESHRDACAECAEEYQLALRMESALPQLFAADAVPERLQQSFLAALPEGMAFDPTQAVNLAMTCREFCDMVGDFVSEELSVDAMLDGVQHASACRPCGDELTAAQTMQDALRSMGEHEVPASIWASLMTRIDAEEAAAAEATPATAKKLVPVRKLAPVLG